MNEDYGFKKQKQNKTLHYTTSFVTKSHAMNTNYYSFNKNYYDAKDVLMENVWVFMSLRRFSLLSQMSKAQ